MQVNYFRYLDEKTQLQQELEQLKDRMDAVVEEFETINEDRVKGLEEIDTLKRKLQTAQQEKDSAQRSFTKQVRFDTLFESHCVVTQLKAESHVDGYRQ